MSATRLLAPGHTAVTRSRRRWCLCAAGSDAERRAYERFAANRAKRLGVLLPGWDARTADASVALSFVEQQLERGISNNTQARPPVTPPLAEGAAAAGSAQATPAVKQGVIISVPQLPPETSRLLPLLPLGSGGSEAKVYVFWDVEGLHPLDQDPRVVGAEVTRIARWYGTPAGLYAYSVRKGWSWVPTYLLEAYGPGRASSKGPAGRGGRAVPVKCPICGTPTAQLNAHMREVHPGQPLVMVSASKRNDHDVSMGNIREYQCSRGRRYYPPAGHQLSLKYVLHREGFDVRVVQNADEAIDRSINGGVDKLLAALRGKGSAAAAAAGGPCVVMLLSNSARHAAAVRQCKRLGIGTIAVCSPGAAAAGSGCDAVLDWGSVAAAEYVC